MNLANPLKRLSALLIDWLMFYIFRFALTAISAMMALHHNGAFKSGSGLTPAEKLELSIATHTSLMFGVLTTNTLAAVLFSIFIIRTSKRSSASYGKILSGIKLIKIDGSPITYLDASLRFLPYIIFMIGSILITFIGDVNKINELKGFAPAITFDLMRVWNMIGITWVVGSFAWIFTNSQRRAPHDLLAGTAVIKTSLTKERTIA